MNPLPGGFHLSEKVCASHDLLLEGGVVVQLGTLGMIVGPVDEYHMHVLFHERTDGIEGYLNVHHEMIAPYRLLVGGFRLGQKIQASMDLVVGHEVAVPFGTSGIVMGEYSDTRLTIAFEVEGQGRNTHFNVLPMEIRAFCDTPCDMPPGQIVQARTDLVSMNSVVVKAGTRGVVIACMDEMRIVVSFDGTDETDATTHQCLTVTFNTIEKATPEDSEDTCASQEESVVSASQEAADSADVTVVGAVQCDESSTSSCATTEIASETPEAADPCCEAADSGDVAENIAD